MKSTGVVRRIDELGRIVLPKEIRRNLGIRDGENLEIFVMDDQIILKKFSKMKDFRDIIKNICNLVINVYDVKLIVTDRDKVIFTNVVDLVNDSTLGSPLLNFIQNRESVNKNELQSYNFNGVGKKGYYFIQPIITSVDCLGLVMVYSDNPIDEIYTNLLKLIVSIIVSKIDIAWKFSLIMLDYI